MNNNELKESNDQICPNEKLKKTIVVLLREKDFLRIDYEQKSNELMKDFHHKSIE